MLPISTKSNQANLFYGLLADMLDLKDPLIVLADNIQWEIFDENFKKYYSKKGRLAKPIRVMVGLLIT